MIKIHEFSYCSASRNSSTYLSKVLIETIVFDISFFLLWLLDFYVQPVSSYLLPWENRILRTLIFRFLYRTFSRFFLQMVLSDTNKQIYLIIDGNLIGTVTKVRVDLEIMEINRLSTFLRSPKLEPYNQMQFSVSIFFFAGECFTRSQG